MNPEERRGAKVFRCIPAGPTPFVLLGVFVLIAAGLGVAQRGFTGAVLLGGFVGAVMGLVVWILTWQRVVIHGDLLWVRLVRWRGPLKLHEVEAAQVYLTRMGYGVALLQPKLGHKVGVWSAIVTLGIIRRSKYRDVVGDTPIRAFHLPIWAGRPDILGLLADGLTNPDLKMTPRTEAVLF